MENEKRVDAPDWYDLLEEAVREPGQLSAAHRFFHRYSLTNCWLVSTQLRALGQPLTPVNTYTGWQKVNRQVQEGEKKSIALWVPAPIKKKKTDAAGVETEEKVFTRFFLRRNWFHMGQTAGDAFVPEEAADKDWKLESALDYLKITEGAHAFSGVNDTRLGWADGREIFVSPLETHQTYGRLREMARIVLGHTAEKPSKNVPEELGMRDIEADTAAYLAAATLGLTGGIEEARLRLQMNVDVSSKLRIPDKCASRAFAAADKLINAGYC